MSSVKTLIPSYNKKVILNYNNRHIKAKTKFDSSNKYSSNVDMYDISNCTILTILKTTVIILVVAIITAVLMIMLIVVILVMVLIMENH